MKAVFNILSGVIIGLVVAYFSLDWKDEKLVYTLTEPAKFGAVSFQNLEIRNDGLDPATNVKVFIPQTILDSKGIAFAPKFDLKGDGQSYVGGFERIRRGERVIVSLTSKTGVLSASDVSIKSDRSVAVFALPNVWSFDKASFAIGAATGFLFVIFATMGVSIPAYRGYRRKAEEAKQRSIDDLNKLVTGGGKTTSE